MSVQDDVRTVTVPRQAEPADAPLSPLPPSAAAPAPATPLVGRDRPLSTEERQFVVALVVMLVGLGSIIYLGLLMAHYVWT